ncbi:hypothetical protein ES703_44384 [subsurface metagenome]
MLVAALDVFINGYSTTGAITGYFGAVWLGRTDEAGAASAEYSGRQQDDNRSYCAETD